MHTDELTQRIAGDSMARVHPLKTQVGGAHYKQYTIQPAEFIHANAIGFLEGNAIKYLVRHKEKGGALDIRKAMHYCELILALDYPPAERPGSAP